MMAQFPNAKLAVHPRGARHMIDPTKLMEGTVAVYGEAAARRLYGEIIPVARERLEEMPHGAVIRLGRRELSFLHTPGHARHHLCIVDSATQHIFAGDTFGLSYREFDDGARQYVFPTSSPVQFDPQELHRSIDLLTSLAPRAVYVTHFGQLRDIPRLASDLHRLLDRIAEIAMRFRAAGPARNQLIRQAVADLALEEARCQNWPVDGARVLEVLGADISLNASGLESWLDAPARSG
jgi:glyoxylase-like metal-dependent hydrolase (beta-lactamase superfamily II)